MAEVDPYFWRVQNPPISHWLALQSVIAAAPSSLGLQELAEA